MKNLLDQLLSSEWLLGPLLYLVKCEVAASPALNFLKSETSFLFIMLTSGLGYIGLFLGKLFPPINNVLHEVQNWKLKEFWYLGEYRVGKRWNYLRDHTACKSIALAKLNVLNASVRWISPRGNKRAKWSLGHLNSHHVQYFNSHKIPSPPLASCRAKITNPEKRGKTRAAVPVQELQYCKGLCWAEGRMSS